MNPQAPENSNAPEVAAPKASLLFNQSPPVYTNFLARALPLAGLGLEVFPIDPRGKEPLALGFLNKRGKLARLSRTTNATKNPDIIKIKWGGPEHAECNVGCFFRGANYGVDIDSLSECEKVLGRPLDIQGARVNTSTLDKLHLYFDGPLPEWFWAVGAKYRDADGEDHELFSVRYLNQHLVGPGSVHPSGAVYSWAASGPPQLPQTNENLLRQLQEIAEKQGQLKPANEPDGVSLSEARYDAIIEKLRENFTRLDFPAWEETEHRGGVAFVFEECPMGAHTDGDPTGMIFVKPDGRICWNCFHNSHAGKWSVIKLELEAIFGAFDFGDVFKGGTVVFTPKGEEVPGGDFDFVLNPLPSSDDGWFPRGDISLLAAASGGGKTTIALELLDKQLRGETLYGHATNKLPYLVLLQDRGQRALRRTLKRLRIDPTMLPYRLIGYGDKVKAIEEAIVAASPKPAVVFIEGIDLLEGDSGKGHNVEAFLTRLQKLAEHYHIAVIGSTGCPKMKPKDKYTSLRDTVIGSSVWSRKVETIVTLQKEHGKETDDITIMTVLPRNAKVEEFRLEFKDGRLVEAPDVVEAVPLSPHDFVSRQGEEPFSRLKLQAAMNWSKTTACDWLALEVERGTLTKEGPPKAIVYRQKIGWTAEDCEKIARS